MDIENRAAEKPSTHPGERRQDSEPLPVVTQNPATPYFARYKSTLLRLPVAPSDLTELGFHQAAYGYALALTTPLPDADMKAAKEEQTTHRDLDAQGASADATLTGSVLRMWRDRPGKPNTAVDVGAEPGTTIVAPIDGTVLLVKRYKLYGSYDDFQVHIRPDGRPELDLVIIHVTTADGQGRRPRDGGCHADRCGAQVLRQDEPAARALHQGRRGSRPPADQRRDRSHLQGARAQYP